MFFNRFKSSITENLLSVDDFKPFPKYSDRTAWENAIPQEYKEDIIRHAQEYLNYDWPFLPITRYLDYYRNGNRSRYESIFVNKRRLPLLYLTIAECLEGKGRFWDDIINGIWVTLDEATWIVPAHNQQFKDRTLPRTPLPDVIADDNIFLDLYAAESGAVISWIYYLLKDSMPEDVYQIPERMQYEVNRRIIRPFLENTYYWMGFDGKPVNNWNPWITSNVLIASSLTCGDCETRKAVVSKALDCLESFIKGYYEDGGCDEGPNYWSVAGSSLYDCLEIIYDLTGGKVDLCNEPLIKNICTYIYKMHINDRYFTNYADASPVLSPDFTLIYRMGKQIKDEKMLKLATALFSSQIKKSSPYTPNGCDCLVYRYTKNFFENKYLFKSKNTNYPLIRDAFFKGIEVVCAREEEGKGKGIYFSAKGGTNNESHNHNDVGSFIIYCDSKPAIIDIGTGVYEKKTFSEQRYEILQMQSLYHNLPIIGKIGQMNGENYRAKDVQYKCTDDNVKFSLDISGAYPESARLKSLLRKFNFNRGKSEVTLTDTVSLEEESDITFVFMTPVKPAVCKNKLIIKLCDETSLNLEFPDELQYSLDIFDSSKDRILSANWGDAAYRNMFKTKGKIKNGKFTFKFYM